MAASPTAISNTADQRIGVSFADEKFDESLRSSDFVISCFHAFTVVLGNADDAKAR
jgi:hypothetical protein